MTQPLPPTPPRASPSGGLVATLRRRPAIAAVSVGGLIAAVTLLRKKAASGPSSGSTVAADGSTTDPTTGSTYDSTSSDVYNAIEPLLEHLDATLAGLTSTTPVADATTATPSAAVAPTSAIAGVYSAANTVTLDDGDTYNPGGAAVSPGYGAYMQAPVTTHVLTAAERQQEYVTDTAGAANRPSYEEYAKEVGWT